MSKIIILMGNAGAGKTAVSKIISKHGFKHIEVDDFYIKTRKLHLVEPWYKDRLWIHSTYVLMGKEIIKQLKAGKNIITDTTGLSDEWKWLMRDIKKVKNIEITTIYIKAPITVLKQRLRKRNKTRARIKDKSKTIGHTLLSTIDDISRMWHKKPPKYDFVVNGNQTPAKVAKDILKIINLNN